MPFIEQILYGTDHLTETPGRQELAHSAGMGTEASAEVHALCEAWGQAPDLGLQYPVLMSPPLRSTMPSMRGRLYAVIRVAPTSPVLFHAVVLSDAAYMACGRNPYAVASLVPFRDEWNGRRGMDRIEIDVDDRPPLVTPPAGSGDVGLVDEAVLEFLLEGKLHLPLEQGLRESERTLALIIACLPESDRKTLKFASFTTAKGNDYGIAGVETEGAAYAGWRRLMMARLDSGATPQQVEYKERIKELLTAGDIEAITAFSRSFNFVAPARAQTAPPPTSAFESPESSPPTPKPAAPRAPAAQPPQPRPVAPARSRIGPAAALGAPGRNAAGGLRPTPTGQIGGIRYRPRREVLPEHGLDPAAAPASPRRASPFRPRVSAAFPGGRSGSGGRFLRLVTILLLIFCTGWVGTMWMEGRTLTESLEWAGLPGMDGLIGRPDHGTTMLEVVDVGRAYAGALNQVGGTGIGLNASGDRARQRALGRLQEKAVAPLREQLGLFRQLTEEGIHSSSRADLELQRLGNLERQGETLQSELDRLELAWFSLATATHWHDLARLTDKQVAARRDSLERAERGALDDVRLGMGIGDARDAFLTDRRQVGAMADLVAQFQVPAWSSRWEQDLAAAAARVKPTAGKTTRAYRNAAFALLRLKKAEHAAAARRLPFTAPGEPLDWPSPAVREILPVLRREAGRFDDRSAPALLAGTVGLYAALTNPGRTADRIAASSAQWRALRENHAVKFDPVAYGDYLSRLRFEAAFGGDERPDPAGVPPHLWSEDERAAPAAFAGALARLHKAEQWAALVPTLTDPFLAAWSEQRARDCRDDLARLSRAFGKAWDACRSGVRAMQADAAAGRDWSAHWRELHAQATGALRTYAPELGDDPQQAPRLDYLRRLVDALNADHQLRLERVTVRLDQERLAAPVKGRLELNLPLEGETLVSKSFKLGPAAPAGTGWVGTVSLDWKLALAPRQLVGGRFVDEDGRELLVIDYPSLAQEGGPASLARHTEGDGGSIGFRVDLAEYWGDLELPDPELTF